MKTCRLICLPHHKPWVEEIDVVHPFLPPAKNLSIVLLSDLHIRKNTKLREIFSIVEKLSPDLLFLLGDYFFTKKKEKFEEFFALLSMINPPLGKFAVVGNREKTEFLTYPFKKTGTVFLRNEYIILKNDHLTIVISGVDYETTDVSPLLHSLPSADLSILLSHSPDVLLKPGDWRKIHLVVSGHTHGGQIRLPLIGAIFTKSKLPLRYASGLFPLPGLYLYVSRGIGMSKLPLRINCPPEITFLKIKSRGAKE